MADNETIEVRAIDLGYYGHIRRRENDEFTIGGYNEFSSRWMEFVDENHVDAWNEYITKKIQKEVKAPVHDEYSPEARIEKAKIKGKGKKKKNKKKNAMIDGEEVVVPQTSSVVEQEMVARKIAKENVYQSGKRKK